jgi:predicted ABC-class ATPase
MNNLYNLLLSTGYPVAYSNFKSKGLPEPPYIVYFRNNSNNISSDDKVHGKSNVFQIELYTKYKDLEAEKKVEDVLNVLNSEYTTDEDYIDSEEVFQVVYTLKLIEKEI